MGAWDQVSIESTSPLWGSGTVALAFLPDGTLSGGIVEDGMDMNLTLAGFGFEWASSRFGSDFISECSIDAAPERECAFTGYFFSTGPFPVPIPEPMGAALLGTGVLGLALARRRPAPVTAPADTPRPGRPPAPGNAVRRRCGRWERG